MKYGAVRKFYPTFSENHCPQTKKQLAGELQSKKSNCRKSYIPVALNWHLTQAQFFNILRYFTNKFKFKLGKLTGHVMKLFSHKAGNEVRAI